MADCELRVHNRDLTPLVIQSREPGRAPRIPWHLDVVGGERQSVIAVTWGCMSRYRQSVALLKAILHDSGGGGGSQPHNGMLLVDCVLSPAPSAVYIWLQTDIPAAPQGHAQSGSQVSWRKGRRRAALRPPRPRPAVAFGLAEGDSDRLDNRRIMLPHLARRHRIGCSIE